MFWRLTPHEIGQVTKGRRAELRAAHERGRLLLYEHAHLAAYAFHDPKHVPRYSPLTESGKIDARDTAIADAKVRGWFIARSKKKVH